jgi:hypothetical protein
VGVRSGAGKQRSGWSQSMSGSTRSENALTGGHDVMGRTGHYGSFCLEGDLR